MAVAVVAVVLVGPGIVDLGVLTDPERLRALVESSGVVGPLVFIGLVTAAHFVILGAPVSAAALLIWPGFEAVLWVTISNIVASTAVFLIARRFGVESLHNRIPHKVRNYMERLETRPARTIVFLRLALQLNPLVDVALAASRIRFKTYLICTVVPMAAIAGFVVFAGKALIRFATNAPASFWSTTAVIAVVVTATATILLRRRARRLSGDRPARDASPVTMPSEVTPPPISMRKTGT
ncbi:TVP38/TMEM64 family protein [Nocardia barduliensis]|uniref:TVP38/TMEM64 family protein n=1 Tax=Nocardia barduliensis TaxID=2736643 RepID=UPI00157488B5|nr:VTT domain-containing protein [Nocardia barduliensis]